MDLRILIKKLDSIFSKYIRLSKSDNGICTCITCGAKHHWKELDCGHFIKRQYMSTRFNEMNCWPQCRKCNWLEQGKDAEYRKFLLEKIGENELNKLEYLKTQTKKWTRFELELLIEHYKEEIKKLNAN